MKEQGEKRPSKRDTGPWPMPPPWLPPEYEAADISAVQAVYAGTATADQQKRAVRWILVAVADKDGLGWHQDSHMASFAAGRRWVGRELAKALMINVSMLTKDREHG